MLWDIPVAPWQIPVRQFLRARDAAAGVTDTDQGIKWISYKAGVLDKYKSNRYCDIGFDYDNNCNYIRFLNMDSSKPPDSKVLYHFVSGRKQENDILMVKLVDSVINIPPRQKQHWFQYQII